MYKEAEIVQWAKDRQIVSKMTGARLGQALKTVEEIAELIENVQKNIPVHDDIGDIYVTLVIQAFTMDTSLNEIMELEDRTNIACDLESLSIKEQLAYIVHDIGVFMVSLIDNDSRTQILYMRSIMSLLLTITKVTGNDLHNCIDHAYDEIAARTGKTVNGVFIKDE